ncbi:hypothetical protein DFH11DRAFT_796433 [Phellopilus nigrolimitatus]|nr:hypothetical protein DFH11DRAFT_796433 [Phellopilus nigrolimitatus]
MSPIDISKYDSESLFLVFTKKHGFGCRLAYILLTSEELDSDENVVRVGTRKLPELLLTSEELDSDEKVVRVGTRKLPELLLTSEELDSDEKVVRVGTRKLLELLLTSEELDSDEKVVRVGTRKLPELLLTSEELDSDEKVVRVGTRKLLELLLTSEELDSDEKVVRVGTWKRPEFRNLTKADWTKTTFDAQDRMVKEYELHTAVKFNKMPLSQEHSKSVFKRLSHEMDPGFEQKPLKDYLAHFLAFLSQDDFNFLDKPKDMTNDELARNLIKLAEDEIEGDGRVISLSELGEKK